MGDAGSLLEAAPTAGPTDPSAIEQVISNALNPPAGAGAGETIEAVQKLGTALLAGQPREAAVDPDQVLSALQGAMPMVPGGAALVPPIEQLAAAVPRGKAMFSTATPIRNQVSVAQRIDPASGQLTHRHVDLRLDGGGITFEFARTYRSAGRYPRGPLGTAWDHSLNLYIRELSPEAVIASSGEFREDRYVLTTPPGAAEYFAPPAGFHSTLQRANDPGLPESFVLTRPDGLTYRYQPDANSDPTPKPGLHRVSRIVDRFGNQLVFDYDLDRGLLHRVVVNDPATPATRLAWFDYDDLDRIIAIHDSTGRTVRYTYDDYDDLVAVTLPATPGHALGRTTFYAYSSDTGPVPHQLLSVIDEDGRRYLEAEYSSELGLVDDMRVIRQRDDEGEWIFEYADLVRAEVSDRNTATRYGLMVRPSGHRIEMELNNAGNLLLKRETAFDEDGVPQTVLTRFQYNRDGELAAQLTPGRLPEFAALPWNASGIEHGALIQQRFARDEFEALGTDTLPTAEQRRAFGNRLQYIRRASPAWPPPDTLILQADDIVRTFQYANPYQQLTSETDPRDATLVTIYHYDPMPTDGNPLPIPAALTRIKHPATTAADGGAVSAAGERMAYDNRGRLTLAVDAEGHRIEREYFAPTDFDEPTGAVTVDGHLRSLTVGVGELDATTVFAVDARGNNVRVTDPRGGVTRATYDAQDLPTLVKRELSASVVYAIRYSYDAEGKLQRQERDVADDSGRPLPDGTEVRCQRWGDTGQLLRESLGGPDSRTWLATRHVYDGEGRLTRTITPMGNITHLRYDAQRRPVALTRGFGTEVAATSRSRYDLAGRVRAQVDPLGHVVRHDHDRFGRLERVVQVVDVADQASDSRPLAAREGHTRVFRRDKLGNVTLERFYEWVGPGAYRLLTRASAVYDERGRAIRIIRDLFDNPVPTTSLDDFVDAPPAGSVAIETWLFYDGNSKVVERREGIVTGGPSPTHGSSVQLAYDAAGRLSTKTIRLPELGGSVASRTEISYDANGNRIRIDHIDNELDAAGSVVAQELIASAAEYDAFNRRTASIDGLGNRTTYRYDSRDLLLEQMDPAGNVTSYEYDRYGRRVKRTQHADPTTPVTIHYDLDPDGRLTGIQRVDGTGRVWSTGYRYDALDRRVETLLAPGTSLQRLYVNRYDRASNLTSQLRPSGLRDVRIYDALNRLRRIEYDLRSADPAHPVLGSPFEQFTRDGLGRTVQAETDATTIEMQFDSMGRVRVEHQSLSGSRATLMREFDTLGNRTTLHYPSGRKIRSGYDSAARLVSIDDLVTSTAGALQAVPRRILQRTWMGLHPRRDVFANGYVTTYARDAAGRRVALEHADGGGATQLGLIQLRDACGKRAQDWQLGTEASVGQASIAYTYDGLNRLMGAGPSSQPAPVLARPILPPAPPAAGAGPPPLMGQNAVQAALGRADLGTTRRYSYDAGGDRIAEAIDGNPRTTYDVDALDRTDIQQFDLDGNALDGASLRRFDARGRMVAAEGGFSATYDALGCRVSVIDDGVKRRFIYDGLTDVAEYERTDLSMPPVSESVVGASIDERIELATGGYTYMVHRDHVGSPRMLTDESGAVTSRLDFDPYGGEVRIADPVGVRHRFMSREWDAGPRLYHFRARHYDYTTGRFVQRDPADSMPEQSAYVAFGAKPLDFVDPLGTSPSKTIDPTGADDVNVIEVLHGSRDRNEPTVGSVDIQSVFRDFHTWTQERLDYEKKHDLHDLPHESSPPAVQKQDVQASRVRSDKEEDDDRTGSPDVTIAAGQLAQGNLPVIPFNQIQVGGSIQAGYQGKNLLPRGGLWQWRAAGTPKLHLGLDQPTATFQVTQLRNIQSPNPQPPPTWYQATFTITPLTLTVGRQHGPHLTATIPIGVGAGVGLDPFKLTTGAAASGLHGQIWFLGGLQADAVIFRHWSVTAAAGIQAGLDMGPQGLQFAPGWTQSLLVTYHVPDQFK